MTRAWGGSLRVPGGRGWTLTPFDAYGPSGVVAFRTRPTQGPLPLYWHFLNCCSMFLSSNLSISQYSVDWMIHKLFIIPLLINILIACKFFQLLTALSHRSLKLFWLISQMLPQDKFLDEELLDQKMGKDMELPSWLSSNEDN